MPPGAALPAPPLHRAAQAQRLLAASRRLQLPHPGAGHGDSHGVSSSLQLAERGRDRPRSAEISPSCRQLKMLQLSREYECAKCKFRRSARAAARAVACGRRGFTARAVDRHTVRAELEERHQMSLPAECTASGGTGKPCGGTKSAAPTARERPVRGVASGRDRRPLVASHRFELVDGSEECHDYQEVRIQEQVRAPALVDSARASGRDASREWLARAESGASSSRAHLSGTLVRRTCQVHRLLVGSIPRSITLLLQDGFSAPSGGRRDSRSRVDGR